MSNEKKKQWQVMASLAIVALCAFLYAWGGIENKWLRRFIAPSIAVGWMAYRSRSLKSVIQLPFMMAALSLGYGSDFFAEKLIRRSVFGLANGVAGSGYLLIMRNWILAAFQIGLCLAAYIILGIWNPLPGARVEETVLGLFVFTIPVMSAGGEDDNG